MMLKGNLKRVRVANPSAKVSQDGCVDHRCSRHDRYTLGPSPLDPDERIWMIDLATIEFTDPLPAPMGQ